MIVSVEFEFDEREHERASLEVLRRAPVRWIGRGFGVLVAAYTSWIAFQGIRAGVPPGTVVLSSLPWLLLALFWFFLLPLMQRRGARQVAKHDPSVRGPQRRIVDETGYHSTGNGVAIDDPAIERAHLGIKLGATLLRENVIGDLGFRVVKLSFNRIHFID